MSSKDTNKYYDVPCEMCLGSGKRRVFVSKDQISLPIAILLKAEEVFGECSVESSMQDGAKYAAFVLRCEVKGSIVAILAKEDCFRKWLRDNFSSDISQRIMLSINRTE